MKDPNAVRLWKYVLYGDCEDTSCGETFIDPNSYADFIFEGTYAEAEAHSEELAQEFEDQIGCLVTQVVIESLGKVVSVPCV